MIDETKAAVWLITIILYRIWGFLGYQGSIATTYAQKETTYFVAVVFGFNSL